MCSKEGNKKMPFITTEQWKSICLNLIGLRSGASANDLKPASYAMNCGVEKGAPMPANWDDLLMGTVSTIMAHIGYKERYLMIVRPSNGTGESYYGTFPKCSARPSSVYDAILMGNSTEPDLVEWVVLNIPAQ
jgi:hypothetical protein